MVYHSGNQLIDPHFLFDRVHLVPGMHVADFGSGKTGNFVFPAAAIVGEKGIVYAVDIVKDALQGIAKRAALDGLANIHTVWADIEQPRGVLIPTQSLDIVLLINFLSAVKNDTAVLDEAHRLLKAGGSLLIVDWARSDLSFAPKENERLDWDTLMRWVEAQHYKLNDEFSVGQYHKGLILQKSIV